MALAEIVEVIEVGAPLRAGRILATHVRHGKRSRSSTSCCELVKAARMVRKVRPDHEEILLNGTAQSVRYGETLRDRSGQLGNIDSPEVANSQNSSWETIQQSWNCL